MGAGECEWCAARPGTRLRNRHHIQSCCHCCCCSCCWRRMRPRRRDSRSLHRRCRRLILGLCLPCHRRCCCRCRCNQPSACRRLVNYVNRAVWQAAVRDVPLCRPYRCTQYSAARTLRGSERLRGRILWQWKSHSTPLLGSLLAKAQLSLKTTGCKAPPSPHLPAFRLATAPRLPQLSLSPTSAKCRIGEAHTMVLLVSPSQPLQPQLSLFWCRLFHHDRLERRSGTAGGCGNGGQRRVGFSRRHGTRRRLARQAMPADGCRRACSHRGCNRHTWLQQRLQQRLSAPHT